MLLVLFFVGMLPKELLETKCSDTLKPRSTPTQSMTGVHTSSIKHTIFFVIAELIVETVLWVEMSERLCYGLK